MGEVKACFRCLEVKPLEEYDIGPSGKRRRSVCRGCVAAEPPKLRKRAKTWQRGGYAVRECTKCGAAKPLTEEHFYRVQRWFEACCKQCKLARNKLDRARRLKDSDWVKRERERSRRYQQERYRKNPEPHRAASRRSKAKVMADPARHRKLLETRRLWYSLKRLEKGEKSRYGPRKMEPERLPRLPAKPVASYLEKLASQRVSKEVNDPARKELCAQLGIHGRSLFAWRTGERASIDFNTLDRILIVTGALWFDIYDEERWPEEHKIAALVFDPEVSDQAA